VPEEPGGEPTGEAVGGGPRSGLHADLYELTMLYGFYRTGLASRRVAFDLFFRANPCGNGFTIAAGIGRALDVVRRLRFDPEDLAFLRSTGLFPDEGFLAQLGHFRFRGDVDAVPEGTLVFPYEPLLQVRGTLWEAQLVETALLNAVGYASLVATKASRVVRAARGRAVLEFGARRAQEAQAALEGARAAVIGGCAATSYTLAGRVHGLPLSGTHGHSWVLSFPSELEAFRAYAAVYPDNLILLVDTYDVLRSGLPHAITVFSEERARRGRLGRHGVRIDSGDLGALSRAARGMLDAAGFPDATVVASNELDEVIIADLERQGARIDAYGVGTRLITVYDQPALGCVYKLVALEEGGRWVPRLKRSENPGKVTTPGLKRLLRFTDRRTGRAVLDLLQAAEEPLPAQPFEVFHPVYPWRRRLVRDAAVEELLQPALRAGEWARAPETVAQAAERARCGQEAFGEELTRLLNPAAYEVHLSPRLWELRLSLLRAAEAAVAADGDRTGEGDVPSPPAATGV
jgi:nicotinate phosphoribosyltransferase